jgi:hypothetical protein
MLQITPAAGSIGPVALTCSAAPSDSTCTVDPASVQVTSGVTASVTVTIATIAAANANEGSKRAKLPLMAVGFFPIGLWLFMVPRIRRRLPMVALFLIALVASGCGVTSTGGSSGSSTNSGGSSGTASATYSPVITATGPGVTQTVTLTLIVD